MHNLTDLLESKLASVRSRHAAVASVRGAALMAGALVLLLSIGMVLDWELELAAGWRALLLLLDAAVLGWIAYVYLYRPTVPGPDDEDIALMVERAMPQFNTRLIASVQLVQPGAITRGSSTAVVRAMLRQTEGLAEPLDFASVIKSDAAMKTVAVVALVLLLWTSIFAWTRDVSVDLLKRAFLSTVEVPRRTRPDCLSKDQTIAIGDPVTLVAFIRGDVVPAGTIDVRYASGRRGHFTIEPPAADKPRVFARTIENVQESFTYRIRANDGSSAEHRVEALPRPTVTALEFVLKYPAYTNRSAEKKAPGDLSLLAGSELQIKVKSNQALRDGRVKLIGLAHDEDLKVGGAGRMELSGTIPIPARGLVGISFGLTDTRGIESRGETVYPVDIVLDKEPTVRVTWPDRKEETATQQAKVLVAFEATDDYGVQRIFVKHKLDTEDSSAARSIELDLSDQAERQRVQRRYEFDLASLKPPQGSAIEYWVEVADGNVVTGPGRASSDHYKAKIVSEVEKRADLMNRLNDQLGTIDYVTQDQEKLNQTLGALILEKK